MAHAKARPPAGGQRQIPVHENFPTFTVDGDVKIIVTGARQYQLHSNVLRNSSSVMRELLDSVDPVQLTNKMIKAGHRVRYKLMLVHNYDDDASPEYLFEPVQLDSGGRPIKASPDGIGMDLENGKTVPPIILAFDTVLGAFYNVPIELGDAQDDGLTHLLSQALQVTAVAEYLDCVHIITPPIESTLLATGQNLYRAISTSPCAWLAFAYRVRSRAIFKEALIHAAGQYHTEAVQKVIREKDMSDVIIELVRAKGTFIEQAVMNAERHLASYYPSVLMREATVGRVDRDNIGRANYANDIMMWIALSIFRHWCCDMIASDQTHHAEDMGFAFVQAIERGGDTYLSKQILHQQFHQRFPMSPKGMACIEHRLAEIKDVVKQWSEPLMRSTAALDLRSYPVVYFTNVNINNKDYPWGENEAVRSLLNSVEEVLDDDDDEEDGEDAEMAEVPRSSRPTNIPASGSNKPPNGNLDNTTSRAFRARGDQDEDMDNVQSLPSLTTGTSADMSIDRLSDGGSEEDDELEISNDDEQRHAAANTLARLRRSEGEPMPPTRRDHRSNSNYGGDTEPEVDQSYQEPFIEAARRRRLEREAVSSQGSQEALEEWIDQDIVRSRREEARAVATAANINGDLRDVSRGDTDSGACRPRRR